MQRRLGVVLAVSMAWAVSPARAACGDLSAIAPAQAGGVTLSVLKIASQKYTASVAFEAKNTTDKKLYVLDARVDEVQMAALGSGAHLAAPNASGIETSAGFPAAKCASNPACSGNLNTFSTIEPHGSLPFSQLYNLPPGTPAADTLTFSVALVARVAVQGDDMKAGPGRVLRFPFSTVPFCH